MKTKLFIIIETVLYLFFTVTEFKYGYSNLILGLHFTSILLSILYVLSLKADEYDKSDLRVMKLMYLVLLPTDYILEFTSFLLPGLIGFLIIQLCYAYRIRKDLKYIKLVPIIESVILVIAYLNGVKLDVVTVVGVFYYLCFLVNLVTVWKYSKNRIFQVGIVIFFLSDIHVFIQKLSYLMTFTGFWAHYAERYVDWMIWVFFVPAQIVVALSTEKENR